MNPLRSVGARLSLALVVVVALALVLVYVIVVPSLRSRLVDAKLNRMEKELPTVAAEIPVTDAQSELGRQSRAVVGPRRRAGGRVHDSQRSERQAPVAAQRLPRLERPVVRRRDQRPDRAWPRPIRAAQQSGTVKHGDDESAEIAQPVGSNFVVLLSASLRDPLANVRTVQRRLVEAGVLALLLALGVGYGAAFLFARRIRRLEAAAERIAAGRFDEPVVDRSSDELGQLARAFDRMRLRLAQLERARREFIGNASHELRTPLFSLRGFLELLTDEDLDEATRAEFLETMREQVDRLQRLAEDLLDLTRLDAGRMHIERQRVDLREVAEDLHDEFRAVAVATGIRWSSRRTATRRPSATKAAS